jgi:hypothetical protein
MTRLIGSLAAVLLALAACTSSTPGGGGGGATTPDPAVAFCDALDAYGATLVKLDALTASSTVVEYKAAGAAAKAALATLISVAGPFVGAQTEELQTAQSVLDSAVDELPPNATPAEAEAALDPAIQGVLQEVAAQHNATCNTRPTPSAAS